MTWSVTLYIDYRSPFSYLVKQDAYALARDFDVNLKWMPFAIDLEGAYGGTVDERSERDWRKVRYSYMDARRMGARQDLIIRGTRKIYNPLVVHVGMLVALQAGDTVFRRYHDAVCERFWRGELDIEEPDAVRAHVIDAGAEGLTFDDLIATGDGARRCKEITEQAETRGVFGVPTFVLEDTGELFWGTDRVWLLRERLSVARSERISA
ncbi:DsbA family protein [Bradyrhizobium manausense]|uniref:DsbA family protein n=1 Tax=Bradyrhizobium manausense TaxID=989370 RepID=UPI001BA86332|nr:DsbA family protein [Bradyrhizobium manausense]MBR0828632.1 DsbA family protein [Bradyrhizobium manausense]